jgi:membrane dipeptidase
MKRREFLETVGAAALARPGFPRASQSEESAESLYRRAYAIDAQCFSMEAPPHSFVQYLRPDKIEALRTSGITAMAMNMTSFYDELSKADSLFQAIQDRITTWDVIVADHSDVFLKVTNVAELEEAKRSGRVGFIFCFQMASPFGWDLSKLETFVGRGVRQIQLADGRRNFIADTCWERSNAGLSAFGFEVIESFNRLGVVTDLSHVGEQSALDAILHSREPVIFSHSGCFELCPHPRNVSDRNIRAMAERGGVFCVYNQSGWLTKDPEISIDHFIAHVEHVIGVAGEDHVGVGTDQDAVDMTAVRPTEVADHQRSFERRVKDYPQLTWTVRHMRVPELSHPKRLLHLAQALERKGYASGRIEKILGGNYVRVFREVVG